MRLVEWNIERGLELDAVKLLMTDKQGFLADLPGRQVTIVTTHIENRTTPKGWVRQADELLEMIRPIRDLLIVGRGYEYDGGGWLSHQRKVDCTEKLNDRASWATKRIK